jgi:eukaryotic-like serine/threonine-protein kinase
MSQSKPGEEGGAFRLRGMDAKFPLHWKSGSLKYSDSKALAEGGTAKLSTCLDGNLRRVVVYKTLHDHLRESDIEAARFVREARVTANIQHPGTVPLYELGRDRHGNLFFTMKKVEGRDLREIILALKDGDRETKEKFPLPRLIDVLIQVSNCIAYAHQQGVIHRDLKPANVIVGGFGEALVLDWGLAKIVGEMEEEESVTGRQPTDLELTPVGRRYGTPLYMSPEIARGDADIDGRSDVFSLGIILFEILTHEQLLSGKDVAEVTDCLLNKPLRWPRNVAPQLKPPPELEAICIKALRREKASRYQSVREMVDDLQSYRLGEEVSVYEYSGIEKWNRWNNRHALTLTALSAGVIGACLHWLLTR